MEVEQESEESDEGGFRVMRMRRPTNVVYRNFETKTRIEERNFFDKKKTIQSLRSLSKTCRKLPNGIGI